MNLISYVLLFKQQQDVKTEDGVVVGREYPVHWITLQTPTKAEAKKKHNESPIHMAHPQPEPWPTASLDVHWQRLSHKQE